MPVLDRETRIARLDGFLAGASSLSGGIREFSAFAYVLKWKVAGEPPQVLIQEFFEPQATIRILNAERLAAGMRELESSIRPFLVRHALGLDEQLVNSRMIEDRQSFLSFRVFDMVSEIAPEAKTTNNVYRLDSDSASNQSKCTFFCMQVEEGYLVLQFNDDRPFLEAR